MQRELIGLTDEAWRRTSERLVGLTDEEYFWEPVAGCWTIRPDADGRMRGDWTMPAPEPAPFTTIAWRLSHLSDIFRADRNAIWIGLTPVAHSANDGLPKTAIAAIADLEDAHATWMTYLNAVDSVDLQTKIGPMGGIYAESTRADLLWHQLDEFIHHSAEVSLLRDLYRDQQVKDPLVLAATRGDAAEVSALLESDAGAVSRQPDLLILAAQRWHWDVVARLLAAGFPTDAQASTGRNPLHFAAASGDVGAVKMFIEAGVDLTARDNTWQATPLEWAEYCKQPEAAAVLASTARTA